jgi:tetratricopeptide (TPR) repeat protein
MTFSCGQCQAPTPAGASFCSRCGARVYTTGADLPLTDAVLLASQLLSAGDIDGAISMLEPHASVADAEPAALSALATAYMQRGRYADALPLLEDATALEPGHGRVHAYLAMAYLHSYRIAEAREAMDEAVRLAPDDFVVGMKHGELLVRLGYYRESIPVLERVLAMRAPDGASLEFTRRLLLIARQKAPNTFSRPVNPVPGLNFFQRWRGRHSDTSATGVNS